jgi:tetratricopeptide (TPR) repeat protein
MLMAAAFLCAAAFAPAAIMNAVKGTIRDLKTGQPIAGVRIALVSARTRASRIELVTDEAGYVYKNGIPTGSYDVEFEKEGYFPARSSLRLTIGDELDISAQLEPVPVQDTGAGDRLRAVVGLVNAGDFAGAVARADEALAQDPGNPMLHYYRGYGREKGGNAAGALVDYAKAAELKPDFALALSSLGKLQARQGDYAKAAGNYKKALAIVANDADALYNYAVCLVNLGDNAGARAALEKVLAADPAHADACYQLGLVLLGQGDMPGARQWLQKFLELDPQHKDAATAKQIIESLK